MKILEALFVALAERFMLWLWSYLKAYQQARVEAREAEEFGL